MGAPPLRAFTPTLLGLSGGLAFVVGSVLFLNPDRYTEGVYLFIYGIAAMLAERLGKVWPTARARAQGPSTVLSRASTASRSNSP